jgi:hypothetical protein
MASQNDSIISILQKIVWLLASSASRILGDDRAAAQSNWELNADVQDSSAECSSLPSRRSKYVCVEYGLEIPVPAKADDPNTPDLTIVRRAWWDAINTVYVSSPGDIDPPCPLRLVLEMRLMRGSNLILAFQYGNLWTVSIGVVSIPSIGLEAGLSFSKA